MPSTFTAVPEPVQKDSVVYVFTGTRHHAGFRDLTALLRTCAEDHAPVFVGDCPTGLDYRVRSSLDAYNHPYHEFKAAWGTHGRGAGPRRNQEMLDMAYETAQAGGHRLEVHAWPSPEGRGTQDCCRRATSMGLFVVTHKLDLVFY